MPQEIDEVRDVLPAVPDTGFVRAYFEDAVQRTGAAALSHLGVALTLLASTCPVSYTGYYAANVTPNLFALIVGAAGDGLKSTPVAIGEGLLKVALPARCTPTPVSDQALKEILSDAPIGTWFLDEFGDFLGATTHDFAKPTRDLLLRIFDGKDLTAQKAGRKQVPVPFTRLSIAAAGAIQLLESGLTAKDWLGGFMSRWLILYSRPDPSRMDAYPPPRDPAPPHLVGMLHERAEPNLYDAFSAQCVGFDAEAEQLWRTWFDLHMRRDDLPGFIEGVKSRIPTIAYKVAMLYAWDFGSARRGGRCVLTMRELVPALRLAELHVRSLQLLGEKLPPHDYARRRNAVLRLFPCAGAVREHAYLLRESRCRPKDLNEVLDGLVVEQALLRIAIAGGQQPMYQRLQHVEVPDGASGGGNPAPQE